jgi:hypothetical protein
MPTVGYECSSNESGNGHDIAVFLIPWNEDDLPGKSTLFNDIFHFHPAVWEKELSYNNEVSEEEVLFHIDTGHTDQSKMCLNTTFGRFPEGRSSPYDTEKEIEFCSWLQKIMVPSRRYRSGDGILNPVVHFLITTLAPGWVGGALTGETWT